MTHPAQFTEATPALTFILSGRARFTLVSDRTKTRYTYRVSVSKDQPDLWFASVLSGPDNATDYVYLGGIRGGDRRLFAGRAGKPASGSYMALDWTLRHLAQGSVPDALEIWHEGRCGRCGRALTDPESIRSGYGPECRGKMMEAT